MSKAAKMIESRGTGLSFHTNPFGPCPYILREF